MEACILAIIEVNDRTAYHLETLQTQQQVTQPENKAANKEKVKAGDKAGDGEKRMEQYVKMISGRKQLIQLYPTTVVADGYFMKKSFIEALRGEGFQVVTKGRRDANLKYLFNGQQKGGPGRPGQFSGKLNLKTSTNAPAGNVTKIKN